MKQQTKKTTEVAELDSNSQPVEKTIDDLEREEQRQLELEKKKIQIRRWIRKIIALTLIVTMIAGQIPAVTTISVSADFTGDGTQVKAFIDVEANITDDDDDDSSWRIARARISMFDMVDFRLKLQGDSADDTAQDYGRVDRNSYGPEDLVDLGNSLVNKDFDESSDALAYNHTLSGKNVTDVALHVILFDVRSPTGGTAGIVSGGFSNTTAGDVYATTTFFSDELQSTQKSIYIRIDEFAQDGSFDQYYLRSINTTGLEYSEMRVYSGNSIFLSSNEYDQNLDGIEFDASSALNGNVTGSDTVSRIARAMIRVPDRLFYPKRVQYSEIGGFMNLEKTIKEALSITSSEDYNLTKLDLDVIVPGDLIQTLKIRFDELEDQFGENVQGWQTALNSLRAEWMHALGVARFDNVDVSLMNRFTDFVEDNFGSGATNNLAGFLGKSSDYVDLAKSVVTTAATSGSSSTSSSRKINLDFLSPLKDKLSSAGSWIGDKKDSAVGWVKGKWDGVKQTFQAVTQPVGLFNNIKEWFEDNIVIIIVVLILVSLLALALIMRRRSARVGDNEVMF